MNMFIHSKSRGESVLQINNSVVYVHFGNIYVYVRRTARRIHILSLQVLVAYRVASAAASAAAASMSARLSYLSKGEKREKHQPQQLQEQQQRKRIVGYIHTYASTHIYRYT